MSLENTCCAGLVLEDGLCEYILLESGLNGWQIRETIVEPVNTAGECAYEHLFKVIGDCGAKKNVPITCALSFNDSLVRVIALPAFSLQEAKSVLRYQLEDHFPFSSNESCFDVGEIFIETETSVRERRFVVAASRLSVIERIKTAAVSQGFRLAAIEPAQIAFERIATSAVGDAANFIAIYAGSNDLLFIISNGENGLFYRNCVIRGGEHEYVERVSAEVKISHELALERSFGFEAERVLLAGSRASNELCAAVADSLSITNTVRCYGGVGIFSKSGAVDEGLLLPLGAAMGQI